MNIEDKVKKIIPHWIIFNSCLAITLITMHVMGIGWEDIINSITRVFIK